jgi:hypothetical protein
MFLTGFIVTITVQECLSIAMPLLLLKTSICVVGWSKKVPETAYPTLPGFTVPSLADLWCFIGDQPEKFAAGFCSVILEIMGTMMKSL